METDSLNILEVQPRPQISLWTIFSSYFMIGLTAFGMAILQKLKALVMKNRWMSEEEMNEGLAMVQLYPGPLMVDFSAYVGYKLRGVMGAILATIGFILPSFVLMSVLSALLLCRRATCPGCIRSLWGWKRWWWASCST